MQTINELIIILSIALTIPFLLMCIEIFYIWFPSLKKSNDASKKLAKGIIYGFSSNFLDNLYWGIAWYLVLINHPNSTVMLFWGSLANIFLRQGGGIIAAFHHLDAANMIHKDRNSKHHNYYWASGFLLFLFILFIKYR